MFLIFFIVTVCPFFSLSSSSNKETAVAYLVLIPDVRDGLYNFFDYEISIFENKIRIKSFSAAGYESNEEAEQACLDKLIEIVKNK